MLRKLSRFVVIKVGNPYREVSKEIRSHESFILDLGLVLSTPQGQSVFKYMLKELEFGELPAVNIPPNLRDEYIGFLRAGQLVFEYLSQADNIKAGLILAQIQKEKMDAAIAQNTNGQD